MESMGAIISAAFFLFGAGMLAQAKLQAPPPKPPAELTLTQECMQAGRDENLARLGGDRLAKYNAKCSHQRLLKEGTTIHAVNYQYMKRKLSLVALSKCVSDGGTQGFCQCLQSAAPASQCVGAASDPSHPIPSLSELVQDGTCLSKDKGIDSCFNRLERMTLDAEVETRQTTLKNNTARKELSDEQDEDRVSAIANTKDISSAGVLRDLYNAAVTAPRPQDPRTRFFMINDPGFTTNRNNDRSKSGEFIANPNQIDLRKGERVNVDETVEKGGSLEVEARDPDQLQKKLTERAFAEKMKRSVANDQKKLDDASAAYNAKKLDPDGHISLDTFKSVMEDLKQSNERQNGKNASLDQANVLPSTKSETRKDGTQTDSMDTNIQTLIDDLRTSSD